jgi:hypothetical protein
METNGDGEEYIIPKRVFSHQTLQNEMDMNEYTIPKI